MKEQRHTHTHNPKEVEEREEGGCVFLLTGGFLGATPAFEVDQ